MAPMENTPRLQFTSVRTRLVDGKPLIGLKHTAKTASGLPVTTVWVDMTPEDAETLIQTIRASLSELH